MLPDGIHTLAYGHKDVQQTLEADHDPPSFDDQIIPMKEATRLGLRWQRRRRCVLELCYDPAIQVEETEEDARAARTTLRGRVADLINQIPNHKYRFLPNENQKTSSEDARERSRPATKFRRIQFLSPIQTRKINILTLPPWLPAMKKKYPKGAAHHERRQSVRIQPRS